MQQCLGRTVVMSSTESLISATASQYLHALTHVTRYSLYSLLQSASDIISYTRSYILSLYSELKPQKLLSTSLF